VVEVNDRGTAQEQTMARKKRRKDGPEGLGGEVLRNAKEGASIEQQWHIVGDGKPPKKPSAKYKYVDELVRLQFELIKLQEWVRLNGLKVAVIFEGRDAAGKGGVIKRITESLNPRICRVVALGTPTEKERGQWYFQRYIAHLPARGEMVLFDRSWYNRAGVERVMGFCTDEEDAEFQRSCPQFERMLVRSGIILIKYWLSFSDEEQERRFLGRINDPSKRSKLSPLDLQARARWVDYSEAKDQMFAYCDIKEAPWHVVETDNKRAAHLTLISHFLSLIPFEEVPHEDIKLPPRQKRSYSRPPKSSQRMVPINYEVE